MKKRKNAYLKKYKMLFVSLLFLFLFLNVMNVAEATVATWDYTLNDQDMEYNQWRYWELKDWCTNCNYFWVTFRNPDNQIQVIGAKSSTPMTYSNSYFDFKINSNGRMDITSKLKNLDEQFSVYAGYSPDFPDTYQYFYVHIRGSLAPAQIKSLPTPITLEGKDSWTFSLSEYFTPWSEPHPDGYTHITAKWASAEITNNLFSRTKICQTSGGVNICLNSDGSDNVVISLKGINQTSNQTLQITAYNVGIGGEILRTTKGNPITLATITKGAYTTPFRTLYPIPALNLAFNETKGIVLDQYWKNITYVNVSVYDSGSSTWVNLTSNPDFPINYSSKVFPEFYLFMTWNGVFIHSFETNYAFPVYIYACNAIGCNGDDNALQVTILGEVPTFRIPDFDSDRDFDQIVLGHNQYKAIDLRSLFSNFDYINITWDDGYVQYNLTTPTDASENRSAVFPPAPVYEISVTFSNIIQLVSGTQNVNFIINVTACNDVGCAPYNDVYRIYFWIQGGSYPELVSQVNSSFWSSTTKVFLDIYPDNERMSGAQKAGVIIVSMAFISILFLFFLNKTEITSSSKMYAVMFINSLLFVFFLVKGYVGVVIPSALAVFILLMIYLKSKGGGET